MIDRAAADLAANERASGEAGRAEERDDRAEAGRAESRHDVPAGARQSESTPRRGADAAAGRAADHEDGAEALAAVTVLASDTATGAERAAAATRAANPISTRRAVVPRQARCRPGADQHQQAEPEPTARALGR